MNKVKVVGLGGSMKPGSASLLTLELALSGAREVGAQIELLDLRLLDLPIFVPGTLPTDGVRKLIETTAAAQAMIWSSPVYHGSISGSFKNALDWMELLGTHEPPYLTDKVIGLISTAGGVQGLQAINTMEFVVRALRGWTFPLTAPIDRAGQALDELGQPRDPRLHTLLVRMGADVARAASRLSSARPVAGGATG